MATNIKFTGRKLGGYGASTSSDDRYFGFDTPSSTGYAANQTVKTPSGITASLSAMNTNGSSSTGHYYLRVQLKYGTTWYTIGYFSESRNNESHTISTFVDQTTSAIRSLMGKSKAVDSQCYVVEGYFWISDNALLTINGETEDDYTDCTKPTSVKVNIGDGAETGLVVPPSQEATLSWSGYAAGNGMAVKWFKIYRSTTSDGTYSLWQTTANNTPSYTVTAQSDNNTSYYYKVETIGTVVGYDSGMSSASAYLETYYSAPAVITNLALASNNVAPSASIALSWTAALGGTNNPRIGYKIEYSTSAASGYETLVDSQTAVTLNVTARDTTGQSYYYKVTTLGTYSNSAPSSYVQLTTTVGILSAPTSITLDDITNLTIAPGTAVALEWDKSADATNNAVTAYKIYESVTTSAGTYTEIGSVDDLITTYDVTAPSTETTRYYKVLAVGARGDSPKSVSVALITSYATAEASSVVMDPTSVYAGDSVAATITPTNVLYTHKIWITLGAKTSTVGTITAGNVAWEYDIPLNWVEEITTATSKVATVTLETYDGAIKKGIRTSSLTILVPASVVPSISTFTGVPVNPSSVSAWEVYIQGISQASLSCSLATPAYGSPIIAYTITGPGTSYSSSTQIINYTAPAVLPYTTTSFTLRVTDARNRFIDIVLDIDTEPYASPTLSISTIRCISDGSPALEGTYGKAYASSAFSTVSGLNAATISAGFRVKGSTGAFTGISTPASSTIPNATVVFPSAIFGAGAIDTDKYYEIRYTVVDTIGFSTSIIDEIPVALSIFHFKNTGKALGIGGPPTEDADPRLDVHWATKFYDDIDVYGEILQNGSAISDMPASDILDALVAHQETLEGPLTGLDADLLDGNEASAFAASSHGNHVPTVQTADDAVYLRNDNSWQTISAADIGALSTTGTAADSSKLGNRTLAQVISDAVADAMVAYKSAEHGIGSLYITTVNEVADRPATRFGGTWELYAKGQALIGIDADDTSPYEFITAGGTGGTKKHNHSLTAASADIAMSGTEILMRRRTENFTADVRFATSGGASSTGTSAYKTPLSGSTDDGSSLMPYVVVYIWRRIADPE